MSIFFLILHLYYLYCIFTFKISVFRGICYVFGEWKVYILCFVSLSYKSYFYNGLINRVVFSNRRVQRMYNISNFGLFDVSSIVNVLPYRVPIMQFTFSDLSFFGDAFFEAQEFKHRFSFEIIWATVPTIIIIIILIPSLYLLYSLDEDLDPKLTIKVIGHTWYWSYDLIIE